MANPRTLTSANSTFTLVIANLYPVPVTIQGWATDNAFDADSVDRAEARMGVDGKLSGGYTPKPKIMHLHLQADSASIDIFEAWDAFEKRKRDIVKAQGVIIAPSTGKVYTLKDGIFTANKPFADHKKLQEAMDFTITWEDIVTAAI